MFVLADKHVFWWPVTVAMPDPDTPGQIVEQGFEGRFEALPVAEAKGFEKPAEPGARTDREIELLQRVLLDWRGIVGPDKAEVPFSSQALARAAQWPWFRAGVYAAYLAAIRGDGARRKN